MKYQTLEGKITTETDDQRGIWYGTCGCWTDEWDKVKAGPPPHCPTHQAVGFQITAKEWFDSAKKYSEEIGDPNYMKELEGKRL